MTDDTPINTPPEKSGLNAWVLLSRGIQLVLLLIIIGLGYAGWDAYSFLKTPASEESGEVSFTIKPGSTFIRVAWDLKKAGLITDVERFKLLAQFKGEFGNIKAGEFLLDPSWTPEQILHQITNGPARLYRLSIREGLPWWEVAKAVEEQGFALFDDFKDVIHDPEFLREHNIPFDNAEGFLFPETYLLGKPRQPLDKEQAREVASVMVRMFWKKAAPAWNSLPLKKGVSVTAADREASPFAPKAAGGASAAGSPAAGTQAAVGGNATSNMQGNANGTVPTGTAAAGGNSTAPAAPAPTVNAALSSPDENAGASQTAQTDASGNVIPPAWRDKGPQLPAQVDPAALRRLVILATLVEKETGVPAERMRVAGVYANRMRLGMLLQCDPTIIYGVGPGFSGAIRRSQLNDEKNLYNTYKHAGLPPGPICSPGAAALMAAAWPEKHDYLFFVATGTGDGSHVFSKTVTEHNRAVQAYRARMRSSGH
jgi:cell division protein YceG involved in septum cleavage